MKKVLRVIVNVIAWIVLILALLVTLLVFTADRNNGVASLLGVIPLTVESPSMSPTFEQGDLIICHEINDINELKKGDVITYWTIIQGQKVKNTHRIVEINDVLGNKNFVTRGDANIADDDISVYAVDIIGKWTGIKIPGFGVVMSFLRTQTGFFICILLPMIIFFLFELYKMIAAIIEVKRPALTVDDEEEIKRKAIEEYLAEQKAAAGATEEKTEEKPAEETKAEEKPAEDKAEEAPAEDKAEEAPAEDKAEQ